MDGGISILTSLKEGPIELQRICARSLFNLSTVDVFEAQSIINLLIPALIDMGRNIDDECQKLGVSGLVNLSCLSRVRGRLMSLGVVNLVVAILGGENPSIDMSLLCVTLLSKLSARRASRTEMVQAVIPALVKLTNINHSKIKLECALTFEYLSRNEDCRSIMIKYGSVPALIQIATSSDPVSQRTAVEALKNILLDKGGQARMVKDGMIEILIQLSEMQDDDIEMCTLCVSAFNSLVCMDHYKLSNFVRSLAIM